MGFVIIIGENVYAIDSASLDSLNDFQCVGRPPSRIEIWVC